MNLSGSNDVPERTAVRLRFGAEIWHRREETYPEPKVRTAGVVGFDIGDVYARASVLLSDGTVLHIPDSTGQVMMRASIAFNTDFDYVVGPDVATIADSTKVCLLDGLVTATCSKTPLLVHGQPVDAGAVLSLLIVSLCRNAEAALGHYIDAVVCSVPLGLGIFERHQIDRAYKLASLKLLRMVPGVFAAAFLVRTHLLSDLQRRFAAQLDPTQNRSIRVLTVDVGASKTDVALMEFCRIDGEYQLDPLAFRSTKGAAGESITKALRRIMTAKAQECAIGGNLSESARAYIRGVVEFVKISLVSTDSTSVTIHGIASTNGASSLTIGVTSSELMRAAADDLDRIKESLTQVLASPSPLPDCVLTVGPSCQLPIVFDLIKSVVGNRPIYSKFQETGIVTGLAQYGGVVSGFSKDCMLLGCLTSRLEILCSVRSHALPDQNRTPVDVAGDRAYDNESETLLEAGTHLPTKETREVRVISSSKLIEIFVRETIADRKYSVVLGAIDLVNSPENRNMVLSVDVDLQSNATFQITRKKDNVILGTWCFNPERSERPDVAARCLPLRRERDL